MESLDRKNVVITGKLKKFERAAAYCLIQNEGGIPKDNMSSIVDVLVIADEKWNCETGKIKKARNNPNITILTENDFYGLIGA